MVAKLTNREPSRSENRRRRRIAKRSRRTNRSRKQHSGSDRLAINVQGHGASDDAMSARCFTEGATE